MCRKGIRIPYFYRKNMQQEIYTHWFNLKKDITDIEEKAANSNLAIYRLRGEDMFNPSSQIPCYAAMIILKGSFSFSGNRKFHTIQAPAFADIFVYNQCCNIETSKDFDAYFMLADKNFLHHTVEPIMPNFITQLYRYVCRPFFRLPEGSIFKLESYLQILASSINNKEHCYQNELTTHLLRSFFLEIWNDFIHTEEQSAMACQEEEISYYWKDTISHFFYLVRTNCKTRHEVKWYAEKLHISPNALSAKLRRTCRKSAGRIINEHLIETSKVYLLDQGNSIQNIAEELHFSDQASFCKFFKRWCGISPSEFRKTTAPEHYPVHFPDSQVLQ